LLDIRGNGTRIEQTQLELDSDLARRVRAVARRAGVTPATIFHAAAALVIAHTSGREDVVFGTVLLGRMRTSAVLQQALGMFINTLPLRLQLAGLSAREVLESTQRELLDLLDHEQASLALVQRCSAVTGTTPLFSVLVNYRHSPRIPDAEWIKADGIRLIARHGFTNYPVTLSVDDVGEAFRIVVQTDRRVAPRRLATYVIIALSELLGALENSPEASALGLSILPGLELEQVVERFNATLAAYPRATLVNELFEGRVEHMPQAVAVIHGTESLTYAALNSRANQLARYLRGRAVDSQHPVAICCSRSLGMVVGVMAIIKAGAAYLPLDPSYPSERLKLMLDDAQPQVVLTQQSMRHVLPPTQAEIVDLDKISDELATRPAGNLSGLESASTPDTPVYVIYTSGSTGRPKGIAMPHRAMANLLEWHRRELGLGPEQRVLQFAALSFDVAFQEIFSTLCGGGALVLLDEPVRRDARALLKLLIDERIERLFLPPLMLQGLAECASNEHAHALAVRDIIVAGEQLRITRQIVDFFTRLEACRLHNHYGPSETHVVTALTMSGRPDDWPSLPSIGRPISNTQIYVLNGAGKPAPLGVAGEIYIGGANVALGYVNRAELTAARFVPDPFAREPGGRMYRTGDLGRWCSDGTLEYMGRNDDQIKIRGYRIELGEIEAQLARHSDVKEVAVVARDDNAGVKRLVAYVTPRGQVSPGADTLRAYMKDVVPEYMVPSAFVLLDRMPLTPSGKLSRRALPAPGVAAYVHSDYDAPRGEIERALADIWHELLRVERVGRDDDFFELGGHSLLAMQLMTRIQSSFSFEIPIRLLFESSTLKDLAAQIGVHRRTWLLDALASGGSEMEELLEAVHSMPESRVQLLLDERKPGRIL
jgi:amino acid adenylation domain-containing protein